MAQPGCSLTCGRRLERGEAIALPSKVEAVELEGSRVCRVIQEAGGAGLGNNLCWGLLEGEPERLLMALCPLSGWLQPHTLGRHPGGLERPAGSRR